MKGKFSSFEKRERALLKKAGFNRCDVKKINRFGRDVLVDACSGLIQTAILESVACVGAIAGVAASKAVSAVKTVVPKKDAVATPEEDAE